jgi:hypothetical protein
MAAIASGTKGSRKNGAGQTVTFQHYRVADEARSLRRLGMSLRAIGGVLGVDEKVVRKALALR